MTNHKTNERIALEQILRLINQFGGENPTDNYYLLCQVRKVARNVLNPNLTNPKR